MRLFIVGQKWLACELLKQCALRHDVLGVAAPSEDDALFAAATGRGIPAWVARSRLNAAHVPAKTDLILAAHAHCFIGAGARSAARHGALGYHPSLLPRHRGRDAIRWAIHMRERVTGGTLYWMDDGADTGPVALQDWCHIREGDTPASLWRRELAPLGLRLFDRALDLMERGELPRIEQDPALASWEPSFSARPLRAS